MTTDDRTTENLAAVKHPDRCKNIQDAHGDRRACGPLAAARLWPPCAFLPPGCVRSTVAWSCCATSCSSTADRWRTSGWSRAYAPGALELVRRLPGGTRTTRERMGVT